MSAHDRYLANYHQYPATVYCANAKCGNHDGTTVTFVSEYGQGWYEPEECESCGGEWLEDQPEEDEDDEDAPTEPQEPSSAPSTPNPTL